MRGNPAFLQTLTLNENTSRETTLISLKSFHVQVKLFRPTTCQRRHKNRCLSEFGGTRSSAAHRFRKLWSAADLVPRSSDGRTWVTTLHGERDNAAAKMLRLFHLHWNLSLKEHFTFLPGNNGTCANLSQRKRGVSVTSVRTWWANTASNLPPETNDSLS